VSGAVSFALQSTCLPDQLLRFRLAGRSFRRPAQFHWSRADACPSSHTLLGVTRREIRIPAPPRVFCRRRPGFGSRGGKGFSQPKAAFRVPRAGVKASIAPKRLTDLADNANNQLSVASAREGKCLRQPWLHLAEKPGRTTTPDRPFRTCRTFASTPSHLGTSFYIIRKSSIPPFRLRPAPKPAPSAPASLTLPLGRVQRVYKGGSKGSHAYFLCAPVGLPMYSPCT